VRRYRSLAQRLESVLEPGEQQRAQAVYLFAPVSYPRMLLYLSGVLPLPGDAGARVTV
jgi:hypothetical protein